MEDFSIPSQEFQASNDTVPDMGTTPSAESQDSQGLERSVASLKRRALLLEEVVANMGSSPAVAKMVDDYLMDRKNRQPQSANRMKDATVEHYLAHPSKLPVLNQEELPGLYLDIEAATEAWSNYRQRDESAPLSPAVIEILERGAAAHQIIWLANFRLVAQIAHQYHTVTNDSGDLIQEGNLGLQRAIGRYDHNRGSNFASYARQGIHRYIQRAIRRERVVTLPRKIVETKSRIHRDERQLEIGLGRQATFSELTSATRIPLNLIKEVKQGKAIRPKSLNTAVHTYKTGVQAKNEQIDAIEDEAAREEIERIENRLDGKQQLESIIYRAKLTPKQRIILALRFGLTDLPKPTDLAILPDGGLTYQAAIDALKTDEGELVCSRAVVSQVMGGVSRQAVQQLEKVVVNKLRESAAGYKKKSAPPLVSKETILDTLIS